MPITSDRDIVRLKIGDTDAGEPLLFDEEVDYFLTEFSDLNICAAACAGAIAAKYARGYTFSTDGQTFNRSERFEHYTALAARLDPANTRSGASTISTVATTKVDGYSEDVDFQEGAGQGSRTGRVRAGYFDPDLPL